MTPAQSRMARAALEWTVDYTGKKAGVPRMAIIRFESGHAIPASSLELLRATYNAAGAKIGTEGDTVGSVRFLGPQNGRTTMAGSLRA